MFPVSFTFDDLFITIGFDHLNVYSTTTNNFISSYFLDLKQIKWGEKGDDT